MDLSQILTILLVSLGGAIRPSSAKPAKVSMNDVLDRDDRSGLCSAPDGADLKRQWLAHHGGQALHPSYYMLPQFRRYIQSHLDRSTSPNEFHIYGNQECPKSLYDIGAERNVQDRSLCPWYNVLNHDPDRYPVDIVEARCKCTSCVGLDPKSGSGCEPVYYNLPVLRRTNTCQEDGLYKYDKGWQKVAVGCTCAMSHNQRK